MLQDGHHNLVLYIEEYIWRVSALRNDMVDSDNCSIYCRQTVTKMRRHSLLRRFNFTEPCMRSLYSSECVHCKNIRTSTDILRRGFNIMKPGPQCNVGLRFIIPSIYGYKYRAYIYTEPVPLKYGKLATYMDLRLFFQCTVMTPLLDFMVYIVSVENHQPTRT